MPPTGPDHIAVTARPGAIQRMGKEGDVPQCNFLGGAVSPARPGSFQGEEGALSFGGANGGGKASRS